MNQILKIFRFWSFHSPDKAEMTSLGPMLWNDLPSTIRCLILAITVRGIHPSSQLCILHIPPISTKFINFLCFVKFTFLLNLSVFASPYFHHDSFMHHAVHVPDASDFVHVTRFNRLCTLQAKIQRVSAKSFTPLVSLIGH